MAKYLVETYYTCSFKVNHYLDDVNEIESAFTEAKKLKGKPSVIIAHTIKGKGVSYMEGLPNWHGSVKLSEQDLRTALTDLGASENEIEEYINEKSA